MPAASLSGANTREEASAQDFASGGGCGGAGIAGVISAGAFLKTGATSDEIDEIANQILAYVAEHPNAQDTVEGITQWWMLERTIQGRILEVQRALAGLVAGGWLVQEETNGMPARYRVNRAKMAKHTEASRTDKSSNGEIRNTKQPHNQDPCTGA